MKTAKGNTYSNLLNVSVINGDLTMVLKVPMAIGNIDKEWLDKAIPWINDRIISEKKPAHTLERAVLNIERYRGMLTDAYTMLFEAYQYCTTPQTRQKPADKAQLTVFAAMSDKMLREFAKMYLSEDRMGDMILPDDRETVISEIMATMKAQEEK